MSRPIMLSCGRVGWQSWQVIIEYVPHSPAAIHACIEDILMAATRRQHPFSLRRLKNYPAQKVDKKSGQRNYWRQLRQRWRRRRRRTVQYAQCVPDGNMIKVKAKTSNKGVLGQDVLQLPLTVAGLCKGTSGVVWSLPGESTDGIRKGTSTCSRLGKWKIGWDGKQIRGPAAIYWCGALCTKYPDPAPPCKKYAVSLFISPTWVEQNILVTTFRSTQPAASSPQGHKNSIKYRKFSPNVFTPLV